MLFLCLSSTEEGTQMKPDAIYLDKCLEQIAKGDKHALASLYNSTSSGVYAFALSILKNTQDAEDVLQECYINVYNAAHLYKSSKKPMAWILTIAKNLCFGKMRKGKRMADNTIEDWQGELNANDALQVEDRMVLAALMKHLSDDERNILILHSVNGFKHREIAELLDMRLATVLSKYNRSLKKLREIIAKGENENER